MSYKSIRKIENDSAEEHYASLRGLTDRFNRGVEYIKNSKVGKVTGNIKDEIALSAHLTKEALKKPETRKLWFKNHIPEFISIGFGLAYLAGEINYNSNPYLSNLARQGKTTTGYWQESVGNITKPANHSLTVLKPFVMPDLPPGDSLGAIHLGPFGDRRGLNFFETTPGEAIIVASPTIAHVAIKAGKKAVDHYENKKQ